MKKPSSRRSLTQAVEVLFPALLCLIVLSACQDTGGGPLTNDPVPAKGAFLDLQPAVAELVQTGDRIKLTASVRDISGKALVNARVLFESSDAAIATVDANGMVTGVAEGVAEIVAKSGTAEGTSVIAVARDRLRSSASVTVYPSSATVSLVGSTQKFLAVARSTNSDLVSNSSIKWEVTNPDVAKVDTKGVVTGLGSGSTKLLARYQNAADTADVLIAPPTVPAAVRVSPRADTIPQIGGKLQLTGAVLNGSMQAIEGMSPSWKTLDASIAAVSEGGEVLGGGPGVARIVAYSGGLSDTARIWVAPAPSAASLFVTPAVDTIPQVGGTVTLTATMLDGAGNPVTGITPTWATLDAAIATVTSAGVVKGVAKGTARITARLNTLVDTAVILVAPGGVPTAPYRVVITPKRDTLGVGGTATFAGRVYDANNAEFPTVLPTWSSLDVAIATVSTGANAAQSTTVSAKALGTARILAKYGTAVDTAILLVTATGPVSSAPLSMTPDADTLAVGDTVRLRAELRSSNGTTTQVVNCFQSSDQSIAYVGDGGLVTARALGIVKITCASGSYADTSTISVLSSTGGGGGGGTTGKPSVVINPAVDSIPSVGGTTSLSVTVRDTAGAIVSNPSVTWASLDASIVSVSTTGIVTGLAKGLGRVRATYSTVADTAFVWVEPGTVTPVPGGGASITPANLRVILGPIIPRDPATVPFAVSKFDSRYMTTEVLRFQDWVSLENDPSGIWLDGNHYGGLRSRLTWAIRTGEAYGPGVTDESKYGYARGRRILKKYLQWSKSYNYLTPAHHNTGLADVEALYVLEGDQDAYNHLHVSAVFMTTDPYGYFKMQNPNADARAIAIAIQATTTAHRLGIPYKASPLNYQAAFDAGPGSWKAVAERQIKWLTQYNVVKADGSVPSPVENGNEAFLFNAWLAKELLEYCGYVQWDQSTFNLARLIMDHMINLYLTDYSKRGWPTLPYTNVGAYAATDLAGFYVWPALVLWQETGDSKYYNFAMQNLTATETAYITKFKQWNQVYSTMAQGAEALLKGTRWR